MTAKINPLAVAPALMKSWTTASVAIAGSLDSTLAELVKLRASQINGCANCINLHAVEAREKGETEQRIYLLPAWREAPCYSDRERAALGWTEAMTRLSEGREHASAYEALKAQSCGPLRPKSQSTSQRTHLIRSGAPGKRCHQPFGGRSLCPHSGHLKVRIDQTEPTTETMNAAPNIVRPVVTSIRSITTAARAPMPTRTTGAWKISIETRFVGLFLTSAIRAHIFSPGSSLACFTQAAN
jgi:AhpD family alkylhydroperoxidase